MLAIVHQSDCLLLFQPVYQSVHRLVLQKQEATSASASNRLALASQSSVVGYLHGLVSVISPISPLIPIPMRFVISSPLLSAYLSE